MISEALEKPLASWKGKEYYQGEILSTLTIILKTTGCSWNRCLMCGYRHERFPTGSATEMSALISRQIAWVKDSYQDTEYQLVKIFTSGSFFDPREVPPDARERVAEAFRGKLVVAETRPEFVYEDTVSAFLEIIDDGSWNQPLYVAMGLETTDDHIREKCIDKGFSFDDFCTAAQHARKGGAGVKAYLLMKPLFLTEKEAIDDMIRSIREASVVSDIISMNPCTVQNRTELEYYWKKGAYRPPYLWSVIYVLAHAPLHVLCDPVGGGHARGPHNCGRCDRGMVDAIRDYTLTQDKDLLFAMLNEECECRNEWEFVLQSEMPWCMPLTR